MNSFRSIAATLFFVAIFAASTFAQATGAAATTAAAQPAAGGNRIGVLDTRAFGDEKLGITRYVTAYKQLQTELKPRADKLQGMNTRLQTMAKDFENLQKQAQTPGNPISPQTLATKQAEAEELNLQLKQEKESYDLAAGKVYQRVVGPISSDISRAMQEYAAQKGFALILDLDKLVDSQNGNTPILVLTRAGDVTEDFIKFYNSRPAGTATTAAPK